MAIEKRTAAAIGTMTVAVSAVLIAAVFVTVLAEDDAPKRPSFGTPRMVQTPHYRDGEHQEHAGNDNQEQQQPPKANDDVDIQELAKQKFGEFFKENDDPDRELTDNEVEQLVQQVLSRKYKITAKARLLIKPGGSWTLFPELKKWFDERGMSYSGLEVLFIAETAEDTKIITFDDGEPAETIPITADMTVDDIHNVLIKAGATYKN